MPEPLSKDILLALKSRYADNAGVVAAMQHLDDLKAKGIEAGVSSGYDEHWIEDWLFGEWGFNVGDVEDLTRGQFKRVLEDMGWDN